MLAIVMVAVTKAIFIGQVDYVVSNIQNRLCSKVSARHCIQALLELWCFGIFVIFCCYCFHYGSLLFSLWLPNVASPPISIHASGIAIFNTILTHFDRFHFLNFSFFFFILFVHSLLVLCHHIFHCIYFDYIVIVYIGLFSCCCYFSTELL